MPSLRPTSSFEYPAAISSTTCRWRSVIGGTEYLRRLRRARLAADRLVERRRDARERFRRRRGIAHDHGDLLQLPPACLRLEEDVRVDPVAIGVGGGRS